ncbi:MAG: DUF6279 family lipoprotein [Gammaproteobacteria bacterium]
MELCWRFSWRIDTGITAGDGWSSGARGSRRRRFRRGPLGGVIVVLGAALLVGCSALTVTYKQLGWLIPHYIDDYIEFSESQRQRLDILLAAQLRWHRSVQLPEYAAVLRQFSVAIKDGLTAAELDDLLAHAEILWRDLLVHLAPDVTFLIATLSPTQVDQLFVALGRRNQDFRGEHVDGAESVLRKRQLRQMLKQAKRWLGDVNDSQQQAIQEWSQRYQLIGADSLVFREQWQGALRDVLQRRHDDGSFATQIRQLMVDYEQLRDRAYREKWQTNLALLKELLLKIDSTMGVEQRSHMQTELRLLADDFQGLAQVRVN